MKRVGLFILSAVMVCGALNAQLIPANLKIRIQKADRINPPVAGTSTNCYRGKDNFFNEINPSAGLFYGYTANGFKNTTGATTDYSTCLIQGNQVYNMGASLTGTGVVPSGSASDASSAFASCGYWLNGTYKSGSTYYGFAHAEGYGTSQFGPVCSYPPTTKSMGLLTSTDGKSWSSQGQIISNPTANSGGSSPSEYGEGDCTPVAFGQYLYLYCRRTQDTQTSIARAPITSNFTQGNWQKLIAAESWGGAWNSNDYAAGLYGSSSSIFTNYGNVMLLRTELGGTGTAHGLQMSFSSSTDPTTFTRIPEPLIYEDAYQYPNASTQSDLVAYPSALSGTDGSRNWSSYFILTYTFVPNQSDLRGAPDYGRTLAMRNVSVSQQSTAQTPQVGIALSRWYSAGITQRVSTVEVVPYNYIAPGYVLEAANTGYLMTVPPASGSKTVYECVSTANYPNAANPDHLLTTGTCDSQYAQTRTAGYIYSQPQGSNTIPLYRCKPGTGTSGTTSSHFASNQSDCEQLGIEEELLGYALAN